MSVQTVARKFMELCNQGKHFEVMRTMYAPEMVSVEGSGKETVDKEAVIKKSEVFQGNNAIQRQDLRGPFFCGDANSGKFAVYNSIDFAPKAGGERQTHEEVGLYTVKNDMITREEFFYDGPFIEQVADGDRALFCLHRAPRMNVRSGGSNGKAPHLPGIVR